MREGARKTRTHRLEVSRGTGKRSESHASGRGPHTRLPSGTSSAEELQSSESLGVRFFWSRRLRAARRSRPRLVPRHAPTRLTKPHLRLTLRKKITSPARAPRGGRRFSQEPVTRLQAAPALRRYRGSLEDDGFTKPKARASDKGDANKSRNPRLSGRGDRSASRPYRLENPAVEAFSVQAFRYPRGTQSSKREPGRCG